jgi:hypothetical protein
VCFTILLLQMGACEYLEQLDPAWCGSVQPVKPEGLLWIGDF